MTPEQRQLVHSVRDRARRLFRGEPVAQRSCGIALAEAGEILVEAGVALPPPDGA
ncbi:MAG TPA: hypothetical protein VEP68_05920 [Anaeromyxobacteraceae bacterium]|nr:hypothetical protein [Anaeromyxobacteraceae bacterium]